MQSFTRQHWLWGAVLFVLSNTAGAAGYNIYQSTPEHGAGGPGPSTTTLVGSSPTPTLHEQSGTVTYDRNGDRTLENKDDGDGSGAAESDDDEPKDDDDSSSPSGRAVTHLKAQSIARAEGRTLTFGQVFRKGDVPSGQTIVAKVNGRKIPTQVDRKATWKDDSLRHAVITLRLPQRPGSNDVEIALVTTASKHESQPAVSLSGLLATDFNGQITIHDRGQSYKADARSLLQKAESTGGCRQWGRDCKHWLSGPLTSEWIVGGPVESNGSDRRAPHLAVYFHVRAYRNSEGRVTRARVNTIVENDWAYAGGNPHNLHYSANLQVGAHSYPVHGLTHYQHARWHRVLWWHGDPGLYARLDTDYLQSTGAISNYAEVNPSRRFLNSRPTRFPPMSHGDQTRHMEATGAQAAIGPLPRWSSTYAVSGDYQAFEWMLANDSAVGSYSFHYRDQQTGRPLRITDHPYVTIANHRWASHASGQLKKDLLPVCHTDCSSPYEFNIAHQPSIGYLPYLVTGDYYYLEEMQFAASYDELWANESYRKHAKGILRGAQGQVRGQAWALREISDAAFATPDGDPMKPYFKGLIRNILSDYNNYYVGTGVNPLHTLVGGEVIRYPRHGKKKVAIAPWQTDFFTWAVGHAAEQDMPGAQTFLRWLAPFQLQRMTSWIDQPESGFCWLAASAYKLQLRDSRNSPIYKSMSEVYRANFPRLVGTQCNSATMILRWNNNSLNHHARNTLIGYPGSPTGYPANFQIGLAMAVDSGAQDSDQAWRLYESRDDKQNYDNYPNFAVVPRSVKSSN